MLSPFFYLLLGYLLIALEFYLPGGVVGGTGALFLIYSAIRFAQETSSLLFTFLYIILISFGLAAMISRVLRRIRAHGGRNTIFLEDDQEGYIGSQCAQDMMGKTGRALTDLRPAGHIIIQGKRYHASAQTGYIPKGTEVEVIRGEGATLFVKKSKP